MKTFSAKETQVKREWLLIDASSKVLGRLASEIATRLRGKHKSEYTPNIDTGDYVVVINARRIIVTGNKTEKKLYHHHTGYIGGIKSITFDKLMVNHPERVIEKAVKGMLPRNSLGRNMYRKLKVYRDDHHPHLAQQPRILKI